MTRVVMPSMVTVSWSTVRSSRAGWPSISPSRTSFCPGSSGKNGLRPTVRKVQPSRWNLSVNFGSPRAATWAGRLSGPELVPSFEAGTSQAVALNTKTAQREMIACRVPDIMPSSGNVSGDVSVYVWDAGVLMQGTLQTTLKFLEGEQELERLHRCAARRVLARPAARTPQGDCLASVLQPR